MKNKCFRIIFFLGIVAIVACSDPTLIGIELLEEDQANLEFTDQIQVGIQTIEGDPVQTYSPFVTLQLPRQLLGNFDDPIFGMTEASIYTQVSLGTQSQPDLILPRFDSLILSLAFDSTGGYGDITQPFGLEVFRMEEAMSNVEDYFSNTTFELNNEPLGAVEFIPAIGEEISIIDYSGDVTVDSLVPAHIRIPLSAEFGESLLQDSTLFVDEAALQEFLKGLYIRPTIASPGLLGIDFNSSLTNLSLYFSTGRNETERRNEYRFLFNPGNARALNLVHNYEGTIVGNAMRNNVDSLVFLQGMTGVNTQVSFPDVEDFRDIIVNKAELELTVATIEGDNPDLYPLPDQLLITTDESGEREIILDVRSALFAQDPIRTEVFGGIPVVEEQDGVILTKYRVNISGHFQEILNGSVNNSFDLSIGNELTNFYFQIEPKAIIPARAVFYGPNHPQFPIKLNLTFTRL